MERKFDLVTARLLSDTRFSLRRVDIVTDQGDDPEVQQMVPADDSHPESVVVRPKQFKLAEAFESSQLKRTYSSEIGQDLARYVNELSSSAFTPGLADSMAMLGTSPAFSSMAKFSSTALLGSGLADSMAILGSSMAKLVANPGFTLGLNASIAKLAANPGFTSALSASIAGLGTSPAFSSMAKLSSTALLGSGLADSMAILGSSMAKLVANPGFTLGLNASIAKLVANPGFTLGLNASIASLVASPAFTGAVADFAAELEVEDIGSDSNVIRLSRKQQRLLCSYLAYVIAWLLMLQILLTLLGANDTLSRFADLAIGMTGLSGHSIASAAKKAVCWTYDQLNPPGE